MKPRLGPKQITKVFKRYNSIERAAMHFGISAENLLAIRNTYIKRQYLQGHSMGEIARTLGLSRERVRQILDSEGIKLSKKEHYLRRFIMNNNPKIKEPKLLEEFLKRNIHRKRATLAKYLNVDEKALHNLMNFLELGKVRSRRVSKERAKAELLAWAKRQEPRKLAYSRLYREKPATLRQILVTFSETPKELEQNPMRCYERFLAELGLSRRAVGMRRRSAGSREEIKKRLLEALSKPRSVASLMYPEEKKAITRGIASNYTIYPILKELLESGEIRKTKILNKTYYFKLGQERAIERLRERAVAYALRSLKRGRKTLKFTLEDAKLAVLMRLEAPMSASELHWIKTASGDRIRLCSEALLNSAISSLIGEGKLLSKRIGSRVYYFKPEQREQMESLVKKHSAKEASR